MEVFAALALDDKAKRFAEALKAKAEADDPCTKTEARALACKLYARKVGNEIYGNVMGSLDAFGLASAKTGSSTGEKIVLKNA